MKSHEVTGSHRNHMKSREVMESNGKSCEGHSITSEYVQVHLSCLSCLLCLSCHGYSCPARAIRISFLVSLEERK